MQTFYTATAAALLAATAQAGQAVRASEICVENRTSFMLTFANKDIVSGEMGIDSDVFAVYETECQDIKEGFMDEETGRSTLNADAHLLTMIKARGGVSLPAETAVVYDRNGPIATFTCLGSTFDFSCELTESEDTVRYVYETVEVPVMSGATLLQAATALTIAYALM